MKIETDEERAAMHALADLLVHGLPESPNSILLSDVAPIYPAGMSTLALLKNMSDILHAQRRVTPAMFPGASLDVIWKRIGRRS